MKCLGRRDTQHLLSRSPTEAVIWDAAYDTTSKPVHPQSAFARGYWEDCPEHGPPEAKHGNKDDPLYRTLYHPGSRRSLGAVGTVDRPRSVFRGPFGDPEAGLRPEFDFAKGETVLYRGERYLVDDPSEKSPRFIKLRHPLFRNTQWAVRVDVAKDTPENLAAQQADPIVAATKRLREITERTFPLSGSSLRGVDQAQIDIWKLDPTFADELVEAVRDEYERHPHLAATIKEIVVGQTSMPNRMAEWDRGERRLILSDQWFGKGKAEVTIDSLQLQARKGTHPKSMRGIRGIVTHEIAHALHQRVEGSLDPKLAAALKPYGVEVGSVGFMPDVSGDKERIWRDVSRYASWSLAELVAEAYADYRADGPDQSELVTLIGSMLEEAVREQAERSEVRYNEGMGTAAVEGPTVTPTQLRALQLIAADREGRAYPGSKEFTLATARALVDKGLIEQVQIDQPPGSTVVRGRFGRGYRSVADHYGPVVRLTDAGRALVQQRSGKDPERDATYAAERKGVG